jgi:hypothetical protein
MRAPPPPGRACKHAFDKASILALLGAKADMPCPVVGCAQRVARSTLVPDEMLAADIAQWLEVKKEAAAAAADEDELDFTQQAPPPAAKRRKAAVADDDD